MDTNETTIFVAVLITGMVIGCLLIFFAITIFRSHRRHFKLLTRHFLAEMELLEKERTRIASDLHDELGPLLAVTQINLQAATGATEKDQSLIEKSENNIEMLSDRFNGIAKNLTPKALVTKGLKTALHDYAEQYKEITALLITIEYQVKKELPMTHSLQIYRIIQELIHNAVKHSAADSVLIKLVERKKMLYISYQDNGKGMPAESINKNGMGLGMSSLKNRAEMLGGKISYSSRTNAGTEYFFEIPII